MQLEVCYRYCLMSLKYTTATTTTDDDGMSTVISDDPLTVFSYVDWIQLLLLIISLIHLPVSNPFSVHAFTLFLFVQSKFLKLMCTL